MKTNARIYVMDAGDGTVKVGHSRDPDGRAKQIGGVTVIHSTPLVEQAELIERTAHRLLKLSGKHIRGEWFRASLSEAISAIERAERIASGHEMPLQFPTPEETTMIQVKADLDLVCKLDDLRKLEDKIPSRTEMVRRLIERAHDQGRKRK
jgi:hypothetical protein